MIQICIEVGKYGSLIESIRTLENKIGKKISVFSKILLSDTGILEDKLDIILNSVTSIHVIEQREVNVLILRRIHLVDEKTKKKLVYASSRIHIDCLPLSIINQIREKHDGLGKILMNSQLEIHKKIVTLGYDCVKQRLFRSYDIYSQKRIIIETEEVMLISDEDLESTVIRNNGPGGI